MNQFLTAVQSLQTPTVIAPPPTVSSLTLPLGLTEMAGLMTPQQLNAAMTPLPMPLTRDEARALQQWMQALKSYRISLGTPSGSNSFNWLRKVEGLIRNTPHNNLFFPDVWNAIILPDTVHRSTFTDVLIQMSRPATPQSVIRISQVMARKSIYNNDPIAAKGAIADTHELLSAYSDFVYFDACQQVMESDERFFPIPAVWIEAAKSSAFSVNQLAFFLKGEEFDIIERLSEYPYAYDLTSDLEYKGKTVSKK